MRKGWSPKRKKRKNPKRREKGCLTDRNLFCLEKNYENTVVAKRHNKSNNNDHDDNISETQVDDDADR